MASSLGPHLELLKLPEPALVGVFQHLSEVLEDAVALGATCKVLHEIGAPARQRYVCCAACGHRLFDPAKSGVQGPALALQDGLTVCLPLHHLTGVRVGEKRVTREWHLLYSLAAAAGIRAALEDYGYLVEAAHLMCGGCGLYMGTRVTQLGPLHADQEAKTVADISNWRAMAVLGQCFLVQRYLRLQRSDGSEDMLWRGGVRTRMGSRTEDQVYVCSGVRSPLKETGQCGAVLFDSRALLSREHRWDAGSGAEKAFYLNHVRQGAVVERNERRESLCQGDMMVADVYCASCAARIGWRFCRDLEEEQDNANQLGRYGLVRSSLMKVPVKRIG